MVDLYGVRAHRERLLARARHPFFAGWWPGFLERCGAASVEQLDAVAFASAVTGDGRLGARAAELVDRALAAEAPWMGAGHRLHYPELVTDLQLAEQAKRLVAGMSWAAPWLGGRLADGLEVLAERAGRPLHHDALAGAWWADAHNSNWCAVLNSGLGFCALACDRPDWLAPAKAAIAGVLDLMADEGAGIEGMGYWLYCVRSSLDLAQALGAVGDGELLAHPFWPMAIQFPLYLALPDGSGWPNFGDCGAGGLGGGSLFGALADLTGDGLAQWLALRALGEEPTARLSWLDLLRVDPDLPAVGPEALPPSRLFGTIHLAALRSGWDPEATALYFKGGSNAWSHCHLDLNSFVLSSRGERLAVDPGPGSYSDHYWTSVEPEVSTAWHNTLTVDGGDQRQPPRYRLSFDLAAGGDAYCRLTDYVDTSAWTTVTGDATSAYGDSLERFRRHVAFLKPDTFVIVDDVRVNAARTQRHLQWLLHSVAPMTETADGVVIRGRRAALHVRVVEPSGWVARTLPERQAKSGAVRAWALRPPWHHLWNVSPTRPPRPQWEPAVPPLYGPDYRFVVVLEVTDADRQPSWSLEPTAGGVRLCRGVETVSVRLAELAVEVT